MTQTGKTFLAFALACGMVRAATYDVREFGATGDGVAKDTAAVQKAIDAAHGAGGGTVRLGAGTYLTGSLFLKSNVDLFLDHGATLKGSADRADYNAPDVCPQNSVCSNESSFGAHLLLCIEQTNVTVRGTGRIDGNSGAFIAGPDGKNWPHGQRGIPWRPSQMLYFVECDGVRVEGVSLIDAPYWSCLFHGCTRVTAKHLLVRTRREPVHTHNGDGLDIDSCEDVEVTACDINTADDCITLRANNARLRTKRDCVRVRVSDCRLSSACNAVRVGVGQGVVRDALLRNLEVYDTRTAVDVVSSWSPGGKGADFENITFDGLKVECKIFCRIYPRYAKTARFAGIHFKNVTGMTLARSAITGLKDRPVDEVTFENVTLPHGFVAINVAKLEVKGGSFARQALTAAETAACEREVEAKGCLARGFKIGGLICGGTAFGGKVALPVRGLCAHQGDRQFFPGNTVEALRSAARKGAAMVEFDVQRCRTGEFVLMHDATIDRLTTGKGRIRDLSLEEIKSFTYRRRFPEMKCRIPTFDEALDVLPEGGLLINVHCYAGSENMGAIARQLKARGRLHQAFVTSGLKDIELARKAVPEVVANNIERPGPRNRDWTPEENATFVHDAIAHQCRYLQLCRPWPRSYSDDAHAGGVKVILFLSDDPASVQDLMAARGIDFVMTNRLTPMTEAFEALWAINSQPSTGN